MPRPKSNETRKLKERAVRLLADGRTQTEVASILGRNLRTVQKWVADPEFKQQLEAQKLQTTALIQSDPIVLSVTELRLQIDAIVACRNFYRDFATQWTPIIEEASEAIRSSITRLKENPDELTTRTLPALMRSVVDSQKIVGDCWKQSVSLDDLLERLDREPQQINS